MLALDMWWGGVCVADLLMETVDPRSAQQRLRLCNLPYREWNSGCSPSSPAKPALCHQAWVIAEQDNWARRFENGKSEHLDVESQHVGAGCCARTSE